MRRCSVLLVTAVLTIAGVVLVPFSPGSRVRAQGASGLVRVDAASISDVRQWDGSIERMLRQGELTSLSVRKDPQLQGRSHQRLDQTYKGVRVFGGALTRQIDRGVTVSVFGGLYRGIDLDVTPTLSAADAIAAVRKLTGGRVNPNRRPELVVLPKDEGGFALAYRLPVRTSDDVLMMFVDARNGAELMRYSDIERQTAVGSATGVLGDTKKISAESGSGGFVARDALRPPDIRSFDMRGNLNRSFDALDGLIELGNADLARDSDNVWTDGANVDAHVYSGWTYDYYFKRFGRRGLDNNNVRMINLVHPVDRDDIFTASNAVVGLFYLNAFFCRTCGFDGAGMMVYGEGLPDGLVIASTNQEANFFAAALDIVAHELTHGVTAYSSGLQNRNESGALNEAFSDVMGTAVEFFFQPPGNGLRQADYQIGEDAITPGGIRSLSNPASLGDPDNYSKRFTGTADNGGVHTNSTIMSQAFYLAIEGGTNRTSRLTVHGVGAAHRDQIEQVFYRAFTLLMPSNGVFTTARATTIRASRDLFGAGSAVEAAITEAWTAVGVN